MGVSFAKTTVSLKRLLCLVWVCVATLWGCVDSEKSVSLQGPVLTSAEVLSGARTLALPDATWSLALSGSRWTVGANGFEGPGAVGVDDAANIAAASAASFGGAQPPTTSDPAQSAMQWVGGDQEPSELYARLSPLASSSILLGAGSAVDARLPVTLEGVSEVSYELVEGVAVARGALPATDILVTADETRLEVFYQLADASAPTQWSWTLGASPRLTPRQEGEAVVLGDEEGSAHLRLTAPGAIDAAGVRYGVTTRLEGQTVHFALVVPEGAQVSYPLLVDPVVEIFTWSLASPSARTGHAMAYDEARGEVVLFGGSGNTSIGFTSLADTWTWDGLKWSQKAPTTSPSARRDHAIAYDAARGEVVLFGGWNGTSRLDDTWTWNGVTWAQQTPATSPVALTGHAMAYDAARGQVVLFGGFDGTLRFSDTWTWDGVTWTQRSTPTRPAPREHHAMAYDAARGEVVLFGGGSGTIRFSDTWTWDGVGWTQRSLTNPTARIDHTMAYDAARGEVVLFGGWNGTSRLSDTWTWDGVGWAQKTPTTSPVARTGHAMAYDAVRGEVVLFGGEGLNTSVPHRRSTWLTRDHCDDLRGFFRDLEGGLRHPVWLWTA